MAKLLLIKTRNLNLFLTLIASFFLVTTGWGQTVTTDKLDYAPGETAIITGEGWTGDQFVDLHFAEDPFVDHIHDYHDIVVNADGTFRVEFPILDRHLGVTFTLTAEGKQTERTAVTVFTDGRAEISNVTPTQILSTSDVVTITAANNGAGNIQNYFIHIRQGTLTGPIVYRDDFSLAQAPSSSSPRISYTNRTWDVKSNQAPNGGEFVPNGLYYIIAGASNSETVTQGLYKTVNVNINSAPVLSLATAPASIDELVAFSLQASATDADVPANTLTFSLTTAPDGASIDGSTGLISWTPTEAQGDGSSYDFTVQVSDGVLTDSESFSVIVNEVNVAPVLSLAAAPASIDELVAFTLQASATDADLPANTLTFSLTTAPTGASIDESTGLISWTPTEAQGDGSSYDFTVQVSDGVLTDSESFSVIVNEVNVAPVLSLAAAPASIDELVAFTLQASATDADLPANTLTFSLTTAPTGASIDESTGLISWTPTEAQGDGSSYDFTVQVSDGVLTDTESFSVIVNEVNVAPVLTLATAPASIDELVAFTLQALATDADLPANTLTFSLTVSPAGATIDGSTGLISWTPTEEQGNGTSYSFTVQVSDGSLIDSETFSVIVNEVNVAPVLTLAIAPSSIDELVAFTLQALATDADLPANTLTFSLTVSPAGATIDGSTGLISWTPTEEQGNGTSYSFTVQVSDGSLIDSETFSVIVNEVNVAPVLTLATAPSSIDELVAFTLQASATDADRPANTLTFSLTAAPAGATIDGSTGLISWTPTEEQGNGTSYSFTVQVSDGSLIDSETFSVIVNEVNVAPVLTLATAPSSNDELVAFTLQASATDADRPANSLTYSLVSAPTGATIDAATGAFSWTPGEAQDGSHTFTVRVSDNGTPSLSASEEITVTVNEVNAAPTLASIGNKSVDELVALSFTAVGSDSDAGAGAKNTLTYSLVGAPTGATIDAATGAFSWTPGEAQDGSHTFTVRVSDNGTPSLSASEEITVTVNEVNAAPTLASIGNKSVDELVALSFTAVGSDSDAGAGAKNTLTYSLVSAPTGATIDAATGAFSWTPGEAQDGSHTFTVRVSDNGTPSLSASEEITVTVNEVNAAPTLASIGNKSVDELVALSFTAVGSDSDAGAGAKNTLTYSLVGAPTGATIDAATGAFSWTPGEAQDGSHTFTVKVSDNGTPSLSASEEITITVNEVNVAPQSTSPIVVKIGDVVQTGPILIRSTITAFASFTDADLPNEEHTIKWIWGDGLVDTYTLKSGVVQNNISKTHTYNDAGVYRLTLIVTDSSGETFSVDYDYVVVYDPNGGFVTGGGWIESPAGALKKFPGVEGRANFGFNAKYKTGRNNTTEVDGNTNFQFKTGDLHFSSSVHNAMSLVISGAEATYTGEGTINNTGSYEFRLIAIDGALLSTGTPDKFRIKIWTKGMPADVIYDNELINTSESLDPTTAISGGSIVIHKPKAAGTTKTAETIQTVNVEKTNVELTIQPATPDILGNLAVAPNPVRTDAKVRFSVIEDTGVTVRLFDFNGREIYNLYSGNAKANEVYEVGFQRNNMMSGIYIVRLTTDRGQSYTKNVIVE